MDKKTEALKLALETLLPKATWNESTEGVFDIPLNAAAHAVAAIRSALAEQPAQTATYTCCVCGVSMKMEQPAQQEPVAFGALAKRRVFDYIRGAYDLGYNDARQARTIHGDGAPGYKGRDVEADHGGALLRALESIASPPAQRKPLTDEQATKAALWDLAVSKGLVTVHSKQLAPGTWSAHLSVASWMEGHDKACDISNEAAHGIKENT